MRHVLHFFLSGGTCIGTKTVLKQIDAQVLCFLTSFAGLERNEDFRLQEITVALDGTA